ncbi:hypothetical protein TKK_0018487 [Trichogramma kaykai]
MDRKLRWILAIGFVIVALVTTPSRGQGNYVAYTAPPHSGSSRLPAVSSRPIGSRGPPAINTKPTSRPTLRPTVTPSRHPVNVTSSRRPLVLPSLPVGPTGIFTLPSTIRPTVRPTGSINVRPSKSKHGSNSVHPTRITSHHIRPTMHHLG